MPPSKPPPAPTVTDNLYALVVYLHASCNRDLLNAIASEQLSFSQLQLLERLRSGQRKPTVRQAAALMRVTPNGASRIVDALAKRGLVTRASDERDSRAKRISITPRGEDVIRRLYAARYPTISAFADQLDADERQELERALSKVAKRDAVAACRPAAIAA